MRLGLVNRVVPAAELDAAVDAIVRVARRRARAGAAQRQAAGARFARADAVRAAAGGGGQLRRMHRDRRFRRGHRRLPRQAPAAVRPGLSAAWTHDELPPARRLFITGGSRGIGLAIALRAARDGANVAIAAKTTEPQPEAAGHHPHRRRGDRGGGRPGAAARLRHPRRGRGARGGGRDGRARSAASTSWSTTPAPSASPARSRRR